MADGEDSQSKWPIIHLSQDINLNLCPSYVAVKEIIPSDIQQNPQNQKMQSKQQKR